jgi:hypothetical protein
VCFYLFVIFSPFTSLPCGCSALIVTPMSANIANRQIDVLFGRRQSDRALLQSTRESLMAYISVAAARGPPSCRR